MIILCRTFLCSLPKRNLLPHLRIAFNASSSKIFEPYMVGKLPSYRLILPVRTVSSSQTCDPKSKSEEVEFCEKLVRSSGPLEPYLRLIRLHKPTGGWLLFWPFGWSIALAAMPGCLPDFYSLLMFYMMAFIMRGAGCTINDMWDKEIDEQVTRTKDRPLATNKITRFDALVFLGGQLGLGCLILLQYNFYTVLLSASSLGLAVSYPLMKKLIPWPQVILGMAMNFGTLLGSPAVHGVSDWAVCLPLYLGGICWTVVYDTIYAYQDLADDKKLGLKSTAISFGENPRLWLAGFSTSMISFLGICGLMNEQTWPYYTSLLVISVHLGKQIYNLNTEDVEECARKFVSNQRVGLILFLGIVVGNLFKSKTDNSKDSSSQDLVTAR